MNRTPQNPDPEVEYLLHISAGRSVLHHLDREQKWETVHSSRGNFYGLNLDTTSVEDQVKIENYLRYEGFRADGPDSERMVIKKIGDPGISYLQIPENHRDKLLNIGLRVQTNERLDSSPEDLLSDLTWYTPVADDLFNKNKIFADTSDYTHDSAREAAYYLNSRGIKAEYKTDPKTNKALIHIPEEQREAAGFIFVKLIEARPERIEEKRRHVERQDNIAMAKQVIGSQNWELGKNEKDGSNLLCLNITSLTHSLEKIKTDLKNLGVSEPQIQNDKRSSESFLVVYNHEDCRRIWNLRTQYQTELSSQNHSAPLVSRQPLPPQGNRHPTCGL